MLDKEIKDIISDDNNIFEVIKESPQTYNSILKHLKNEGTLQIILRRRIARLCKEQRICKMRIPGTRFGLVLFCVPNHKYKIFVADGIISVRIFYMFDYDDDDKNVIFNNYWELKGPNWSKWVYSDEEVRILKYALRGGITRKWE